MITKLETTSIQNSISIHNSTKVLKYFTQVENIQLAGRMKHLLKKSFGEENTLFQNSVLNRVWILEYNNLIFNIFCSERGTSYEIVSENYSILEDSKIQNIVIDFLKEIKKLLE